MKVDFEKALSLLQAGNLVALPTETVYGLAGRIDRPSTIKKIFAIKSRPLSQSLIVHCYSKSQAQQYVLDKNLVLDKLWDRFCPGPLSLVLKKNKKISALITGGRDTVALRIPQNSLTRRLIKKLGVPLAAPSANPYGKLSPVCPEHVLSGFKNRVPVLDGGPCSQALESTILALDLKKQKGQILRPGILTKKQLENFFKREGLDFSLSYKTDPLQPGGGKAHYRPLVPFYIVQSKKTKKAIQNQLAKRHPGRLIKELVLLSSGSQTAKQIYKQLFELSQNKKHVIYVQKKSSSRLGLWTTIWDRLEKSAFKKIRL